MVKEDVEVAVVREEDRVDRGNGGGGFTETPEGAAGRRKIIYWTLLTNRLLSYNIILYYMLCCYCVCIKNNICVCVCYNMLNEENPKIWVLIPVFHS